MYPKEISNMRKEKTLHVNVRANSFRIEKEDLEEKLSYHWRDEMWPGQKVKDEGNACSPWGCKDFGKMTERLTHTHNTEDKE